MPTCKNRWPDSNPANPPGSERLANALTEALEAIEEMEQASADGWEDELLEELPGVAWTLNNLYGLVDSMMAPFGADLVALLAALPADHGERVRIIYEHRAARTRGYGPVCPSGQCRCDQSRERWEQEGLELHEPVQQPAEACEPVLVAGRSA